MKYTRFEELPVWQSAIKLSVKTYALTATPCFKGHGSLRDQIERAAVSVSNNVAEGYERGTTQELLTFLYIARGSAGEVRSMLCLIEQLPFSIDLKSEISNLKLLAENISRQLRAWADSLQNTDIKGQRYLNEKSRRVAQAETERIKFREELRQMQEGNIARLQREREQSRSQEAVHELESN